MDLKLADHFLSRFSYNITTLQVFPTIIEGKARWPKVKGHYLATGEKGSSATSFKGSLSEQPFLDDLIVLQRQRMGVYFMVNEGDGLLHDHKIVRNSDAVTRLTALFVDTDSGDHKVLDNFLKGKNLKPHIIIESSPKKYHYYFLLADTPLPQVSKWKACQNLLSSLDPGFDSSMSDTGKVLRIPGFYHTKAKPFLIKPVFESAHPNYDLTYLYKLLGAEKVRVKESEKFTHPTTILKLGKRHEALSAFLGSLSNSTRDSNSLLNAGIGFAQRHFENPAEWSPKGSRFEELQRQVGFVLEEREKEELEHSLNLTTVTSVKGFKKLPDDFYLNAPGIVGEMVREICHYSAKPYPSFAFAASCALIGTLKAPYIRGKFQDTPPSTFFLCLAGTGRGKDFPRAMIAKVFLRLGFSPYLTQKFRSAQGFLKRMSKSNSIHLCLHDEAHHLFAQIRKGDTDYITAIKPHLLSLFSAANDSVYDAGAVITQSMEIPPLSYPVLNYCGFGVPKGFEESFQSQELNEGLLSRFLVLRDHQPVLPVSEDKAYIPSKFKFEIKLRELAAKLRQLSETAAMDAAKAGTPHIGRKFHRIPYDKDAFALWREYSIEDADFRNDGIPEMEDNLRSRLVEQAMRLAIILSDEVTTREIMQFSLTFVKACYENSAMHIASFDKGQGNKDLDDLVGFISTRMRLNAGPMQVGEFKYFRLRDSYSLNNTIKLATDLKLIKRIDNYRKPGINKGRTSTAYVLIDDI